MSLFDSISPTPTSPASPSQSALAQLGKALQTGDISAARAAYRTVQENVTQETSFLQSQTSALRANPIAELAQAVLSDNLSAAQQAVSPEPPTAKPGRKSAGAYKSGSGAPEPAPAKPGALLNERV